ncbi:MAG TPA: thiamine-phosphate kinase [Steroidobacteraceae bacterium]|nr:thiamine-phosphate kinase [Steroidobacteraceae bacterium]
MAGKSLPNEFDLIARYFAPLSHRFPGAYGLLDDVAVISASSGAELVVKSDVVVGGIDFPPGEAADLIARKALRVNLSDLAAKGATPRAYLLDLVLPGSVDEDWIAAFAAGLAADQAQYGVDLIGGDMSSTSGPVTIAICAFGEAPRGAIIRRGGARPGDTVFVTGTIGDAALGLALSRSSFRSLDARSAAFLLERYQLPQPRVTLGPQLIGIATAGLDVSDGLIADLRHLCCVSRLSAVIEARLIPLSRAARVAIGDDPEKLAMVLGGGDDYEILFTASAAQAARVEELSRSSGVSIAAIGHMSAAAKGEEPGVVVRDELGRSMSLPHEGWAHFGTHRDGP